MVALLLGLLVSIPPLSPEQIVRLETARDGRDHREEAFVALVESVRSWGGSIGDAPIVLHPDLDAMILDPAGHRGRLCRVEGVLQQTTALDRPHQGVSEWFVRDDDRRPILVYVVHRDGVPAFRDGQRLALAARFFKYVDAEALDGTVRRYPAFVGAFPRAVGPVASTASGSWMLALPIGALLVAFVALLAYTRRQRRGDGPGPGRRGPAGDDDPAAAPPDDPPLPPDPADALAELRRRSS